MALTDRRERFVQLLIQGKSQREAYKLAGYKVDKMTDNAIDVEASKIFKNPEVTLRFEELRSRIVKEAEEETMVSVKWVLENLKYVAERCLTPEPLTDKEGNVIEWRFDSSGANKALETIGKHLGMFKEKVEHSGAITHSHKHDLKKLSTKELADLEHIIAKSADSG